MSTPELETRGHLAGSSLLDLQRVVNRWREEAIGPVTVEAQGRKLLEEAGEARTMAAMFDRYATDATAPGMAEELAEELADVIIVTAGLAELVGVHLGIAVESKMRKNTGRTWDASRSVARHTPED